MAVAVEYQNLGGLPHSESVDYLIILQFFSNLATAFSLLSFLPSTSAASVAGERWREIAELHLPDITHSHSHTCICLSECLVLILIDGTSIRLV